MEYLEDYDFTLHYHPGKENVVVDALGRKSRGVLANVDSREWQMLKAVGQFGLYYSEQTQGILGSLSVWRAVRGILGPQKSSVHIHAAGSVHEIA